MALIFRMMLLFCLWHVLFVTELDAVYDHQFFSEGWSQWSPWTACYNLDKQNQTVKCLCRERECEKPNEQFAGTACRGMSGQKTNCTVHGGWSDWSEWSACNKTCGKDAFKKRTRTCTMPPPAYGGQDCTGPETDMAMCTDNPLCSIPIDDLSNLIILFDITMLEINYGPAKAAALKIVDELSERNNMIIHNYTLIVVDQDSEYREFTTIDIYSFKAFILRLERKAPTQNAIVLDAISDCLNSYSSSPFILVFTDNNSNDSITLPQVLSTIEASKTRVIFFLNLKTKNYDLYPIYNQIVTASQGHIFSFLTIESEEILEVWEFIHQVMNVTGKIRMVPGDLPDWPAWVPCTRHDNVSKDTQCYCSIRKYTSQSAPTNGGDNETTLARVTNCTEHGGWSEWSEWSDCNSTCKIDSSKTRKRTCTNPVPAFGGDACIGNEIEIASCYDNLLCQTTSQVPTVLPSFVILFDTTMKKKNFRQAKATALKIVEGLSENNIIIQVYTVIAFDQGLKYQELTTTDVPSFKIALQKIARKSHGGRTKILSILRQRLKSTSSKQLLVVFTDNNPDDSTSVSQILPEIDITKIQIIFALNLEKVKGDIVPAYNEIVIFVHGLTITYDPSEPVDIPNIVTNLNIIIPSQSVQIGSASLPNLVVIFDTAMLEENFGPAKASALKIIDEFIGNNIIIQNYILIAFDQGLKYQELTLTDANAFKMVIQKLVRKSPIGNSKVLAVLRQCLNSRLSSQLIFVYTDNTPDDSTSVSQLLPDIDITKIQIVFVLNVDKIKGGKCVVPAYNELVIFVNGLTITFDPSQPVDFPNIINHLRIVTIPPQAIQISSAILQNLVIIFGTAMLEENFGPAKSSSLKIIDELIGKNIIIQNYILISFGQGLKYQELTMTDANAFKIAIQKLVRTPSTGNSKILAVLRQCLKSRLSRQLIFVFTDNTPDDSTSVSQLLPDIDITKIQIIFVLNVDKIKGGKCVVPAYNEIVIFVRGLTITFDPSEPIDFPNIINHLRIVRIPPQAKEMGSAILPNLVIIFDIAMLEENFGPAKSSALKIIDELIGKNIIIQNYILVSFDQGLKYQELTMTDANAFKIAIQKLVRKPSTGNSKVLAILRQCLKSRSSSQLIFVFTDNTPDDSTSVSQLLPDIDIPKIQIIFVLNVDKIKGGICVIPAYNEIMIYVRGLTITFDPSQPIDFTNIINHLRVVHIPPQTKQIGSAILPNLVIIFDTAMLKENFGPAKSSVLKIIDELIGNNIIVQNYILIAFDQSLKYQELTFTNANAFKIAVQKLVLEPRTGNSKVLAVLRHCLKLRSSSQLIFVYTDNTPDDSTSVSQLLPDIDITKIQIIFVLNVDKTKGSIVPAYNELVIFVNGLTITYDPGEPVNFPNIVNHLKIVKTPYPTIQVDSAILPNLVIIFDTAMLEENFGPAKSSALKIIDELIGKNIIIQNYILISFDQGVKYQELTMANANAFKIAIQKLIVKPRIGNSKVLAVLRHCLKSRSSGQLIFVFTDNTPDDSTSVSQILPDIDVTKIQIIFVLNVDESKGGIIPAYNEIVIFVQGLTITFDPSKPVDFSRIINHLKIVKIPPPAIQIGSAILPNLVIIFDTAMLKENFGPAKSSVLKIIDELIGNNIIVQNYILIAFDQSLKYQELTMTNANAFKIAIQKLVIEPRTGNSKVLAVLRQCLKSRLSSQLIFVYTDNTPDDSTSVSQLLPDIDITKIQIIFVLNADRIKGGKCVVPAYNELIIFINGLTITFDPSQPVDFPNIINHLRIVKITPPARQIGSAILPKLVIIFDTAMLEKNFNPAKSSALKIIDDLIGNNIIIQNYVLIAFDQGAKYQELTMTNANAFKIAIQKLVIKPRIGNSKVLAVLGQWLKSRPSNQLIFVFTDNTPDDSTSASQILPNIDITKMQIIFVLNVDKIKGDIVPAYNEIVIFVHGLTITFDPSVPIDIPNIISHLKIVIISSPAAKISTGSSGRDLTFVLDISDTIMLHKVKSEISSFLLEFSATGIERLGIQKYILIPFTDSEVGNAIQTTDVELFSNKLHSLTPHISGKVDPVCSRKSLSGIKKGLESSSSNSVLIVFTDASPNDDSLFTEINSAIEATHSQVIFILMKHLCNPHSKEYFQIAVASNGLMVEVEPKEISAVLKFIHILLKNHENNVKLATLAGNVFGGTNGKSGMCLNEETFGPAEHFLDNNSMTRNSSSSKVSWTSQYSSDPNGAFFANGS